VERQSLGSHDTHNYAPGMIGGGPGNFVGSRVLEVVVGRQAGEKHWAGDRHLHKGEIHVPTEGKEGMVPLL